MRRLDGQDEAVAVNAAMRTEAFRRYWAELQDRYRVIDTAAERFPEDDPVYERAMFELEGDDAGRGRITVVSKGDRVEYSEAAVEVVTDGSVDRFQEYGLEDGSVELYGVYTFHDTDPEPGSIIDR